jgi:hypothetical protein
MNVAWPALLRLTGEAELLVVHDQAQWEGDPHLQLAHYLPTDALIDADGKIHSLQREANGRVVPQPTRHTATLAEVITAVQAHAAQAGSCCVAKFSAASIREAIMAVEDGRCLR